MKPSTSQFRYMVIFAVLAGLGAGAAAGVGSFTFFYAKGASYMSNDPEVCANCHIMQDHYDAYSKSSHHAVATCNDCHTLAGLIPKLATKAINGWNHSLAFTTGNFPDPLRITSLNQYVTEKACRKCHQPIIEAIDAHPRDGDPLSCIRCHNTVGHLE